MGFTLWQINIDPENDQFLVETNLPTPIFSGKYGWENHRSTKWGPQTIAKLVQITPISLWFMVPITIVFMGFINHLTSLGGPTLWNMNGI